MENDKVENIVEGLDSEELKKIACQALIGKQRNIVSKIESIARLSRMKNERNAEIDLDSSIEGYEEIKRDMQSYGVWEEKYEQAFKEARDKGRVDTDILYGRKETDNSYGS